MNGRRLHIAIVGGGITGLAAAFYLQKKIKNDRLPLGFTVIEADRRLGGKIQTAVADGFVMEKGPDSFLARKRSAADLVAELGMAADLVRNEAGQAYILHENRLHPMPEGAVMGIPTKWRPFFNSRLVSPAGKARAALDLVLPRSGMEADVSIGAFFRRRLGTEVVEHMIEPLLSGIYAGDIDRLSLLATFPQFAQLEAEHRSLIAAMRKTRPPRPRGTKRQGQFLTLKGGLQSLVDALEKQLPPASIVKNAALQRIERRADTYRMHIDGHPPLDADAAILAVPSGVAQRVLAPHAALEGLNRTAPTSVANVVLAYPREAVPIGLTGTGFVVPRTANYTITACTWTHHKWPHTAPAGKALLRCYVGRPGNDRIVEAPDEDIVQTVLSDLRRLLPIKGEPDFYLVNRWHRAMPQYVVGHRAAVKKAREEVKRRLPKVVLAGASYEGVGIPDCIDQGKKAADDVIKQLWPAPADGNRTPPQKDPPRG